MKMFEIPRNEILWERIYDVAQRPLYAITSDKRRDVYYIYKMTPSGKTERLGKGKNPPDLIKKFVHSKKLA